MDRVTLDLLVRGRRGERVSRPLMKHGARLRARERRQNGGLRWRDLVNGQSCYRRALYLGFCGFRSQLRLHHAFRPGRSWYFIAGSRRYVLVVEPSSDSSDAWLLIAQSFRFSAVALVVTDYAVALKALRGFQQFTPLFDHA